MRTYQDHKHRFAIDLPDGWRRAPALGLAALSILSGPQPNAPRKDVFQLGCYDEAFNFEIGRLSPAPPAEQTEREFLLYARSRGFVDVHFGRIVVGDKAHVCARYRVHDQFGPRWHKKYMIVFGETEYTITGTCNEASWFALHERDWDTIVQSFRLVEPAGAASAAQGSPSPQLRPAAQPRQPSDEAAPALTLEAQPPAAEAASGPAATLSPRASFRFAIVMLCGSSLLLIWAVSMLWSGTINGLLGVLFIVMSLVNIRRAWAAAWSYRPIATGPVVVLPIAAPPPDSALSDTITRLLAEPCVIAAIRDDLRKTDQIAHRELWMLAVLHPAECDR